MRRQRNGETRVGKLVVTLGPVMYNFTEWRFDVDAEAPLGIFRITVSDAAEFPDCARFTAQGFIEYISRSTTSRTIRVTSERLSDGSIVYSGNPG